MLLDDFGLPRIVTQFDSSGKSSTNKFYRESAKRILSEVLPENFFVDCGEDPEALQDLLIQFQEMLPLLVHVPIRKVPCELSCLALFRHRSGAFRFYCDMISRWLVPGTRQNILMLYGADIQIPELDDTIYTVCEAIVQVESQEVLKQIQKNLPAIETELCLGIQSSYQANQILEIKGMSNDEKTASIQEHMAFLVKRLPEDFGLDVFHEMQHLLVTCPNDFKAIRKYRHLSRIISIHYLFRKDLRRRVRHQPNKRHLSLKVFKARLHPLDGVKMVLGIVIGLNFIRDNELFEDRHILKAVQSYVSNVEVVEGSFFNHTPRGERVCTLYVEIRKTDGSDFTCQEIRCLRRELPGDLKDRIQHLMHPIFMPHNEEEVMRNMLALSNQLRFVRDLPQVMISFDEQTDEEVVFSVILLRILKPTSVPIADLFAKEGLSFIYEEDRSKTVGILRKKYQKEATVFRIKLSKQDYLREDHSLDMQRARLVVSRTLQQVIGEFRDYNGGMISKQNEQFCALCHSLGETARENEFLLENFFYSITPVVARTIMEPKALKELFLVLLGFLEEAFFNMEPYAISCKTTSSYFFAVLRTDTVDFREEVERAVQQLAIPSVDLASARVTVYDTPYLGYIYRSNDADRKVKLQAVLSEVLDQAKRRQMGRKAIGPLL